MDGYVEILLRHNFAKPISKYIKNTFKNTVAIFILLLMLI